MAYTAYTVHSVVITVSHIDD